ncbi:MAG: biotin transporter BioY [Candidatus Omnitrophica bacterium]|nr:biotin transporter BioY [Candidatus Omnitrophota bacterium]
MDRAHALQPRELISDKNICAVIGVLFFMAATTLGAYVRIPLQGSPVPITLQTFFVILSGAVLGRRFGTYSQFGYVALGMSGLPLFQGVGAGMAYLMGPTGGYLMGFILASYLIGRMINTGGSGMKNIMISFIAGDLLIHSLGTLWLICIYRIDVARALSIGMFAFIPGEIVKISAAAIIFSRISGRSEKIFSGNTPPSRDT